MHYAQVLLGLPGTLSRSCTSLVPSLCRAASPQFFSRAAQLLSQFGWVRRQLLQFHAAVQLVRWRCRVVLCQAVPTWLEACLPQAPAAVTSTAQWHAFAYMQGLLPAVQSGVTPLPTRPLSVPDPPPASVHTACSCPACRMSCHRWAAASHSSSRLTPHSMPSSQSLTPRLPRRVVLCCAALCCAVTCRTALCGIALRCAVPPSAAAAAALPDHWSMATNSASGAPFMLLPSHSQALLLNKQALEALAAYHIVPEAMRTTQMSEGQQLKTLAKDAQVGWCCGELSQQAVWAAELAQHGMGSPTVAAQHCCAESFGMTVRNIQQCDCPVDVALFVCTRAGQHAVADGAPRQRRRCRHLSASGGQHRTPAGAGRAHLWGECVACMLQPGLDWRRCCGVCLLAGLLVEQLLAILLSVPREQCTWDSIC